MTFKPASRVANFGTTVFADIAQLVAENNPLDLSTGVPDTDGPPEAVAAVAEALHAGHNQYADTQGERVLREAVAEHACRFYGQRVNPDTEVTVTNGAVEALYSVCTSLINPGDEVIIVEPYYEVFVPDVLMADGVPRFVPLHPPDWHLDLEELADAFGERTRAIIVNTPHNPTGRVFTRAELETISALCRKWNAIAITDEVYEHLVYDGARHVRLATLPTMHERTITIGSISKTFSFTGWRIGWTIAPPDLTRAIRLAHQYVVDCSATPMQHGAAAALRLPDKYFTDYAQMYAAKRDSLIESLLATGLDVSIPQGSYFILAGIEPLGFDDDFAFCRHLIRDVGVASIPPSAFFSPTHRYIGRKYARFAFCKTPELLQRATERLATLGVRP